MNQTKTALEALSKNLDHYFPQAMTVMANVVDGGRLFIRVSANKGLRPFEQSHVVDASVFENEDLCNAWIADIVSYICDGFANSQGPLLKRFEQKRGS